MRLPPRIGGQSIQVEGETPLAAALRIAPVIVGGVFPIQGPPGTGKTYIGARMICTLVAQGKTVGVTANSHKVIRNLLNAVLEAATEMGVDVQCVQKPSEMEPDQRRLRFVSNNADLLDAIVNRSNVAGGTAWLWASPDAANAVDVLFIDEAAQMSLANVLAVSQAARSVVLLGDPSSSNSRCRAAIPKERTCPRSITFFKASKQSRKTAAFSSTKPGDCTRRYARIPLSCSTPDACVPVPAWRLNAFKPRAASPESGFDMWRFRRKETKAAHQKRRTASATLFMKSSAPTRLGLTETMSKGGSRGPTS